jgi:hypothetical protein
MNIQTEKSLLIDLLQNINDISLIQKVKRFVLLDIEPIDITANQKEELGRRLADHKKNTDSGVDAFKFLDDLKANHGL